MRSTAAGAIFAMFVDIRVALYLSIDSLDRPFDAPFLRFEVEALLGYLLFFSYIASAMAARSRLSI